MRYEYGVQEARATGGAYYTAGSLLIAVATARAGTSGRRASTRIRKQLSRDDNSESLEGAGQDSLYQDTFARQECEQFEVPQVC